MVPVFTNLFSVMGNEREVVLEFKHQYPSNVDLSLATETHVTQVSSLVMTPALAAELYNVLGKVVDNK